MCAALASPARRASVDQPWPRLARCVCGEEILLARHAGAGRPITLELVEVLPLKRCDTCRGTGKVIGELRHVTTGRGETAAGKAYTYAEGPVRCEMCDGTGLRGEQLGPHLVLVSGFDGVARAFTEDRSAWEAAHRRHVCAA